MGAIVIATVDASAELEPDRLAVALEAAFLGDKSRNAEMGLTILSLKFPGSATALRP